MLNQKDRVYFEYNTMYDILYVKLKDSYDTYVVEKTKGVLINHDYTTKEITGFDIWDFKKRMENKEHLTLPIPVDFNSIYNSL